MRKFFKAMLVVVTLLIATFSANAQSNLIYNAEEVDGVVVSETVYKLESGTLTNYMKHFYKYDENNERIEDEAQKWNGVKERWEKDLCIRYKYTEKSITTEYYKWNKKKKDYVIVPEMTVTMDR